MLLFVSCVIFFTLFVEEGEMAWDIACVDLPFESAKLAIWPQGARCHIVYGIGNVDISIHEVYLYAIRDGNVFVVAIFDKVRLTTSWVFTSKIP